jgi:hypothetical protein
MHTVEKPSRGMILTTFNEDWYSGSRNIKELPQKF